MKIASSGKARARATLLNRMVAAAVGCFAVFASLPAMPVEIESKPLYLGSDVPGNLVLVPSVEYPTIISNANLGSYSSSQTYAGYFDSAKCYLYHYDSTESNRYFYPASYAASHKCSSTSQQWSGNYLNWAVTQTIDPFRKALTGGYRVKDTATETWLEKARHDRSGLFPTTTITSQAVMDSAPSSWGSFKVRIQGLGNQMWIANSQNPDSVSASNVIAYDPSKYALDGSCIDKSGKKCNLLDSDAVFALSVRVKVCDPTVGVESNCKQYSSGNWKPEGLIQEYSSKLTYSIFGYLNDSSWDRDGGVLRANQKFVGPNTYYPELGAIANASREWDPGTGVQFQNPDSADATATGLNVRDSGVINYLNKFGEMTSAKAKSLDPVSELYYAAIRYLKNLGNVASYSNSIDYTKADGFPVITSWNDPIRYSCQVNAILGIGDVNTHRDKNLPGSTFTDGEPSRPREVTADDTVDVMKATQKVFDLEGLGTLRNPFTGRYNSAFMVGLAYDAHTKDMRPDDAAKPNTKGSQTVSTYWVDVRENQYLEGRSSNQYWLAAKYGGFNVPSGYDPYARTAALPEAWWHTTSDYLTAGSNGGITQTATNYPRADNFYVASEADKMVESLRKAFESIVAALKGSGTAMAANTTKLEAGAMTFQAQFVTGDNNEWSGELLGYKLDTATGALEQSWAASGQFPLWGPTNATTDASGNKARQIYYNNAGTFTPFQGAISGLTSDQVNYVRGDRSQEASNGGALRNRQSILGDIVNSQPVYAGAPNSSLYANQSFTGASTYAAFANSKAGRTKVVYVGANDGMLHAFNADTGRELFAFIPSAAISGLAGYTSANYQHAYSVDGGLTVADAFVNGAWKTILVGTMGRGGNHVFALDVTDPTSPSLLWEKSDASLGNNLGKPIIAQVANGDWRVLLGNGPNSSTGNAQLVMVSLSNGSLSSIDTGVGRDNGLSGVNAWSSMGNGIVDAVYAGDLKGNLWKFQDPVSGASPFKLFAAGNTKPITSAPLVAVNPDTLQTWVWFGTGQYLNSADIANTATQTWYGLIDGNTQISSSSLNKVDMLAEGSISGTLVRTLNSYDATGARGWYFDLPDTGERMVVSNEFVGTLLEGVTRIPNSSDVCSPGGTGYTMIIDPFTGGRSNQTIFDVNGDRVFDDKDTLNGVPVSGIGHSSGPAGSTILGDYMYTTLDNGTTQITKINSASSDITRVSWRELIRE